MRDFSFMLGPFIVLSVAAYLCCIAAPRLRTYAFRALVAPLAFGVCSTVGGLAGLATSARLSVLPDRMTFVICAGIYLLCGVTGAWFAVRMARHPWNSRTVVVVFGVVLVTLAFAGTSVMNCARRGRALQVKEETLRQEAEAKLRIGTERDAVSRFFDEHGMKVTFAYGEASGSIITSGCAPFLACGKDSALIGLRVHVDSAGTVTSQPDVIGMYTDCL